MQQKPQTWMSPPISAHNQAVHMRPPETIILDWLRAAAQRHFALVRKSGLMNWVSQWHFLPIWAGMVWLIHTRLDAVWLLLPANLSLFSALGLFRRYRLIEDTPTSPLSSGAQGYVELQGNVRLPEGEAYRGLPHLPATVWLLDHVEAAPFVLDDGHGQCLLYPQNAEIVIRPSDGPFSWLDAIYPGQTLYALGELHTRRRDASPAVERRERMANVLAEWKSNPTQLLQHFDANRNGQIDPDEWQTARQAAERWVSDDMREASRSPGSHTMAGASTGQVFLITNIPPETLASRYRWATWLHTLAWLGLLAIAHTA